MKNYIGKFTALLLSVIMIAMLLPLSALAAENTTDFAGGDGSAKNPYLIANKQQLANASKYLEASFKLTADITLTKSDTFKPIGEDGDKPFTGSFDGDSHTISGLVVDIKSSDAVYAGLFGYNAGTVENLGVLDFSIVANATGSIFSSYAGAVCGFNEGVIDNCYSTGDVTAVSKSTSAYAGAIAGNNTGGEIISCYNSGDVTSKTDGTAAKDYAGGIVGSNFGGKVESCYNTGKVSGKTYVGGIAGYNQYAAVINRSYNMGSVTASDESDNASVFAGGIAGYHFRAVLTNCYNTGAVTASAPGEKSKAYAGGIVGNYYKGSDGVFEDTYNIGTVKGTTAGGVVGKSDSTALDGCYYLNTASVGVGEGTDSAVACADADMKKQSTFVGFDFGKVWDLGSESYAYPVFKGAETADPEIKSIEISSAPVKTVYAVGSELDLEGLKVTAKYSNGKTTELSVEDYTVTGFKSEKGEQTVTVSVGDITATFKVNVYPKGDMTKDGKVTVSDILEMKTIIMSGELPTAEELELGDLKPATPDGKLTVSDILGIKEIIMG